MTGPLPLELAQIRDNNEREAAAMAARRRSEDTRPGGEIGIIKLRRSSTGDTHIVTDDIATRRSSRPIKRRKFDDEVGEGGSGGGGGGGGLTPISVTPVAPPPPALPDTSRSRNSSFSTSRQSEWILC